VNPRVLHGRRVVGGRVTARALVSRDTLSGWGGIDPSRGVVVERHHELCGVCFAGTVLVFPGAKGSSGWSGFFQACRLAGTAPAAMLVTTTTTKSALGAVVTRVPSLSDFDVDPVTVIRTGDLVTVDADAGTVTIHPGAEAPDVAHG
jgi:predicted aconitase with swiveling domain